MDHPNTDRRAVVIGSGFGGLAVAIRLQAAGVQVTLLEKREKIGGRAYQLEDQGYVFDMGPSLITSPGIIDDVFRAAGRRFVDAVDLIPLDPFYRIFFHDGSHLDYVADADRMKEQMAEFNPRDAERFDDFMKAIAPIYDAVIADRLGSKPFDTWGSMLRFVPRVVKLGAWRPVHNFVARYFEDYRHRFIYSFHPLFVGGNPFSTPAVYLMIPYLEKLGGVWFSRGGMYSVVQALGDLFEEIGGTLITSCPADRIEVENGRAVGVHAGGEFHEADLVVSNADVGHTYRGLIDARHRKHWTDRKVENTSYTMSCFLLYLGTKRQYPQLEHHTLILAGALRGSRCKRHLRSRRSCPDDFSACTCTPRPGPTRAMAPRGMREHVRAGFPVANQEVRTSTGSRHQGAPLPTAGASTSSRSGAWRTSRSSIDVLHVFTPDDFESELNATFGNAFAVEPKLTQTAYLRPQNRSEDVDGLYLVGAGTHPGAGVPGVILSAETTYGCIAEDLGLPAQWDWDAPGDVRMDPERGPSHEDAIATLAGAPPAS